MISSGYDQYKQQSIITLTPGEMIVKLYDEAIKRCNFAAKYIGDKDYEAANVSLKKAQDIVSYLKSSLDKNYSISGELEPLYSYINNQLIAANVKKTAEPVTEILPILKELRDAFSTAEKSTRQS